MKTNKNSCYWKIREWWHLWSLHLWNAFEYTLFSDAIPPFYLVLPNTTLSIFFRNVNMTKMFEQTCLSYYYLSMHLGTAETKEEWGYEAFSVALKLTKK